MKLPKPKSAPEELFALQLRLEKLAFTREVKFSPTRKWRLDFVVSGIAVEIQGGGWHHGRHSRELGMQKDYEKHLELMLAGYKVLYCTPAQVKSGQALAWLKRLLGLPEPLPKP